MTTDYSKFKVRIGTSGDAQGVVNLFSESGNPHQWSLQKWEHYYKHYPEGKTVFFVAEAGDKIIGHYGLFPVTIGGYKVFMGAHAHISEKARCLAVISSLMKSLDQYCQEQHIPFIVGFANPRFTTIKTKLFKWKAVLWASFIEKAYFDPSQFQPRPFSFEYSNKWLQWRFNVKDQPVISCYSKMGQSVTYQLLNTDRPVDARDHQIKSFECWSPEGYEEQSPEDTFAQPFSIKVYDSKHIKEDLLNPENWLIQMGDSDTFTYMASSDAGN